MGRRLALPLLVLLLVIPLAAPAGAAQGEGIAQIEHHQSVLAHLTSVGVVRDAKVVTQLTATGQGPVTISSPDAAIAGLRNLDGFGRPAISDGSLSWDLDLSGTEKRRTIADYDKDLPLAVSVDYELDGETVRASRLRSRSGLATVTYTVENTTVAPTEISYRTADGDPVTESVDVAVPYVATLTVVLPEEFRGIEAPGATIYGDGQGSTVVRWTMLLFEPLGEATSQVSVTARMSRGTVPGATLEAIPVSSSTFASLASALEQYESAERDTHDLRNGARDLDRGAVRLAAGAGRLLNGMMQLAEGSQDLRDGLTAARDGSRELADGMGRAATGGRELATGLGAARGGAVQILDGLAEVDGGLALLQHPTEGLPAAEGGISDLRAGIAEMRAGLGDPTDPHPLTIIGGLDAMNQGAQVLAGRVPAVSPGLPGAKAGVDAVQSSAEQMASVFQHQATGSGALPGMTLPPTIADAQLTLACAAPASVEVGTACAILAGYGQFLGAMALNLAGETNAAGDGPSIGVALTGVSVGLSSAIGGIEQMADNLPTLAGGARQIAGGLSTGDLTEPGIDEGLVLLTRGLEAALGGIGQLSGGTGQLVGGQGELVSGLTRASTGAGDLADGLGQLDAGASQLADGMVDAATGSGALADGLQTARIGGQQVADGSASLQETGTARLFEAMSGGYASRSELTARLAAVDARGVAEGLPYGVPEGATATAAYRLLIAGSADAGGTGDAGRGLAGLLLLAGAVAIGGVARRRTLV